MTAKPRLLYMHIPKTGGSTLRVVIERQYPRSTRLNIHTGRSEEGLKVLQDMTQAERDEVSCVIGHLYFGIHHLFPNGENTYITMLRHPVKQIISNYYFTRTRPPHRHYEMAKSRSLVEYAQHPGVQSLATRYIAGLSGTTPETLQIVNIADEATLERAKANLRDHYKVIGFTEEFDASLLMMKNSLGWGNIYYYTLNTSDKFKKKEPREKMTPELMEALEAACPLDMALYRYALELYEVQKDAYGRDKLARDVERFQRQNRVASQVMSFGKMIKPTRIYRKLRRMLKQK